MEFRVSIASERQRVEAAALVDECYWSAYGIRPSELFRGELPPFRHEVLVATRPDGGVLGTATLSWPSAEGLFPGEYLFHGDFHKPGLPFDWPHMVEYGKLAIHPEAPREVFKELQRGFVRFGRTCGITGFVAVVRTELGERLRQCFAYQTIATELYDTGPIEERMLRKLSTYIDKGNLQFIASSLDAVAEGLSVND